MELYVIRRPGVGRTPEEVQAAAARSRRVGDEEMSADVRWIRSYVVQDQDGRLGTFCIYEASSEAKIREHAARAGIPATDIFPVADTVIVRPDPVALARIGPERSESGGRARQCSRATALLTSTPS